MKKVKWRWVWGVYVLFCPYCDEPAYGKDQCAFCGRRYKWVEGKHKPTVVTHMGYRAVQSTNNHITVYDEDGDIVINSSCNKKYTEDELKIYIEQLTGRMPLEKRIREEKEGRERKT